MPADNERRGAVSGGLLAFTATAAALREGVRPRRVSGGPDRVACVALPTKSSASTFKVVRCSMRRVSAPRVRRHCLPNGWR